MVTAAAKGKSPAQVQEAVVAMRAELGANARIARYVGDGFAAQVARPHEKSAPARRRHGATWRRRRDGNGAELAGRTAARAGLEVRGDRPFRTGGMQGASRQESGARAPRGRGESSQALGAEVTEGQVAGLEPALVHDQLPAVAVAQPGQADAMKASRRRAAAPASTPRRGRPGSSRPRRARGRARPSRGTSRPRPSPDRPAARAAPRPARRGTRRAPRRADRVLDAQRDSWPTAAPDRAPACAGRGRWPRATRHAGGSLIARPSACRGRTGCARGRCRE